MRACGFLFVAALFASGAAVAQTTNLGLPGGATPVLAPIRCGANFGACPADSLCLYASAVPGHVCAQVAPSPTNYGLPGGAQPYRSPSGALLGCTPGTTSCPSPAQCLFAPTLATGLCAVAPQPSGYGLPDGSTPYRTSTGSTLACSLSSPSACPAGYLCLPASVGALCATPPASLPAGYVLLLSLTGTPLMCSPAASSCPAGSQCLAGPSGYVCAASTTASAGYGLPAGMRPYLSVSGQPVACTPGVAAACPAPYSCVSTSDGKALCATSAP